MKLNTAVSKSFCTPFFNICSPKEGERFDSYFDFASSCAQKLPGRDIKPLPGRGINTSEKNGC